jgi:hypothetical protein
MVNSFSAAASLDRLRLGEFDARLRRGRVGGNIILQIFEQVLAGPVERGKRLEFGLGGGVVQSGESGAPVFAPRLVQGVVITETGLFRMILVTAPSIVITSPPVGIPGG